MPRKGLVISITAAIIVLVAFLAACGESATPTPTPMPTPTATPTPTPTPVPSTLQCGIGPIEP
ncbi:MAG: hypothetical protein V3U26_06785, partial [Dehalococcoidia bacterium]